MRIFFTVCYWDIRCDSVHELFSDRREKWTDVSGEVEFDNLRSVILIWVVRMQGIPERCLLYNVRHPS
jgi:hypothetical protein